MYGRNIKTLRIDMIQGGSKVLLLEVNGAQGNSWQNFEVDLPQGGPYKVAYIYIYIYFDWQFLYINLKLLIIEITKYNGKETEPTEDKGSNEAQLECSNS